MGFQDEDFEKAEKVNSNTQLYKQAGNSIVVNVLIAILTNLLIPGQAILQEKQLSIYDMGWLNVKNIKKINKKQFWLL